MAPGLWIVRLRSPFDRAEFASAASPALLRCARAELDRPARRRGRAAVAMRSWPQAALIGAVRGYRFFLSPWLGSACRFEPTCSAYALEALEPPWRRRRPGADARPDRPLPPVVRGRPRPRARQRRRGSSPPCSGTSGARPQRARLPIRRHDRHPPNPALGHLPRLAVLHLGVVEPPQRPAVDVRAAAARGGARRGRALGRARADARPRRRPSRGRCRRRRLRSARRSRPRPPLHRAPAPSQQVTVSTDLVRATIDSTGATLARVELLKQVDPLDHSKHVVLLDRSASRLYLAETGLVPPAGGAGLPEPSHADARRCRASARSATARTS